MPQGPLVAIVDDDDSIRGATENLLEAAGYSTTTFSSAESFISSDRRRSRVSCVVADMRMPGMTGLELFEALVASGRAIPTVLITAYPDEQTRLRARQAGILCYLSKPFSPEELCACVDAALARTVRPKS